MDGQFTARDTVDDDIADLYAHLDAAQSHSSISTYMTAPNLPGPGRTLGLFYDFAGRILVSSLNRFAQKLRSRSTTVPSGVVAIGSVHSDSRSSISTNATAPNLPGAGRMVGLFYDAAGRVLEMNLNKFARRIGLGPQAVATRIINRVGRASCEICRTNALCYCTRPESSLSAERRRFEHDCRLLLRYATAYVTTFRRCLRNY